MPDTYELFVGPSSRLVSAPDPCEAVLPVNPITDEFRLFQFVELFDQDNVAKRIPLVVPLDVVNPELVAALNRVFPDSPPEVLRGGISLNANWRTVTPPQSGLPVSEITVSNLNEFLSDPKVKLSGKTYRLRLTPAKVNQLVKEGSSQIIVTEGDVRTVVRITAKRSGVTEGTDVSQVLTIPSIARLVSNPTVRLASGESVSLSLSPQNIEELRTLGITKIALSGGRTSVYLRKRVTAQPTVGSETSDDTDDGILDDEGDGPIGGRPGGGDIGPIGGSGTPGPGVPPVLGCGIFPPRLSGFDLVVFMPYRHTWQLLGYSRGELVNTISLAPQEETTIEIFTWDRIKRAREETLTTEREATFETTITDKDSLETMIQITTNLGWKNNTNLGLTVPIESIPIKASGDAHVSADLQNIDKVTHQTVSEAVEKATARIRSTRQIKVEESEEFGSEQRVTRKIKNANMCRTLNFDYFQVLATYQVTTKLMFDQIKLCVLTPNLIRDPVDRNFLICHEGALREAILSPVYLAGFDAARKVAAWERYCKIKCASCPCDDKQIATGPPDGAQIIVANAAKNVMEHIRVLHTASPNALCKLADDFSGWLDPAWGPAREQAGKWLYWKVVEASHPRLWSAGEKFLSANRTNAEALEKLLDAVSPDLIEIPALPSSVSQTVIDIFQDLGQRCESLPSLIALGFFAALNYDDAGLPAALRTARIAFNSYKRSLQQAEQIKDAEGQQQTAGSDKSEEIAVAQVAEQALISHILKNESHYRNAIWQRLDPDDRFRALSLLGNLFQYVDNQVLGFIGNRAALPLRVDKDEWFAKWFKDNVTDNDVLRDSPAQQITVTLPSRAATMDGRLGQCDVCEDFIMQHRGIDIQLKRAEVEKAQALAAKEKEEAERYKKRLEANPPQLDAPSPCCEGPTIRVLLDKENGP